MCVCVCVCVYVHVHVCVSVYMCLCVHVHVCESRDSLNGVLVFIVVRVASSVHDVSPNRFLEQNCLTLGSTHEQQQFQI